MNTILIYKGNKELYRFTSCIIPSVGQYIWIDGSALNYKVTSILYDLITSGNPNLEITLMVE
jgi:hypothetical protein